MPGKILAALALFLLAGTPSIAQPAPAQAPPHIERLARVARLWGTVRHLHPYLAYKEIDWDAALVRAIPRIREAKTSDEFRSAVQAMLDALGDPVSRVLEPEARPAPKPERPSKDRPLFRVVDDRVVVMDLGPHLASAGRGQLFEALGALERELPQARAVVVDLRTGGAEPSFWSEFVLSNLVGALVPRPVEAPAQRHLLHSGYRPQDGATSGGYYSGFVTHFADSFVPTPGRSGAPARLVFLLDRGSRVPPMAVALHARGAARLVVEGGLEEHAVVSSRVVDLGEGIKARVRVSEIVPPAGWRGLRGDVEVPAGDAAAALEAAIAEARKEWPPSALSTASAAPTLPGPVFRPDKTYPEMTEPALEYRQLAVARAWNVIHWFYPYLHLIGDWDPVLPQFLARMEAVTGGHEYALTVLEMMTHVPDGHTGVWGHPEIMKVMGEAGLPILVRWVEGAPVAVQVSDEARQAGLEIGDAILAVDGEPVAARAERLRRYVTASTPSALLNRTARVMLLGGEGSTAVLTVEKADGRSREVRLVRSRKARPPLPPQGDVVQILRGNWGYVDLTRLTVGDVDAMFEKVKETRGLIMDMRGYPQGTAWPIAPRINTRKAKVGAQFRRAQVSAMSEEEGEAGFYFSQPLPAPAEGTSLYTAPTVMLIDDRAISQSEHSGLFFEAANGTTFIGTATAGANGDVTRFGLPGGIWVGFTGHDVRHADGRQLQRVGLEPHVEVAPTRAGLRAGRDEVLERAIRHLEETAPPRAATGPPR